MSEPARRRRARAASPSFVYAIGRVDQGVRREMRRRLQRFSLSVPEYTALSILAVAPGLSNAQLARRSLITPPAMLEVLASLERRGLVERHADPEHGRIRRAELTAEGTAALRAASRDIDRLSEELLADVPAGERDIVRRGLVSAMDRLSEGFDQGPEGGPTTARRRGP
jgi:DNA-binding MarR family transcriptional regulator